MNHPEKDMWNDLREHIGNNWDAWRHENKFGEGMPDVSFGARAINGWMELKTIPDWPVRPDTIVRIHHFTQEQRIRLWRRGEYGGHCWFLLKISFEWLLFNHRTALRVGKNLTKRGLLANCDKVWFGLPPAQEFITAITK